MSKILDFIRRVRYALICCKKTMDIADNAHEAIDEVIDEIIENLEPYVIDERNNQL